MTSSVSSFLEDMASIGDSFYDSILVLKEAITSIANDLRINDYDLDPDYDVDSNDESTDAILRDKSNISSSYELNSISLRIDNDDEAEIEPDTESKATEPPKIKDLGESMYELPNGRILTCDGSKLMEFCCDIQHEFGINKGDPFFRNILREYMSSKPINRKSIDQQQQQHQQQQQQQNKDSCGEEDDMIDDLEEEDDDIEYENADEESGLIRKQPLLSDDEDYKLDDTSDEEDDELYIFLSDDDDDDNDKEQEENDKASTGLISKTFLSKAKSKQTDDERDFFVNEETNQNKEQEELTEQFLTSNGTHKYNKSIRKRNITKQDITESTLVSIIEAWSRDKKDTNGELMMYTVSPEVYRLFKVSEYWKAKNSIWIK